MKFKLDENLGKRTQQIFHVGGHDVRTVVDQALHSCSDDQLYKVCRSEQRCLVTLDLDFADVTRFPPEESGGIVVIRVPKNPSLALIEQLIHQLLQALTEMSIGNHLWIVEVGRIRIHQTETEE